MNKTKKCNFIVDSDFSNGVDFILKNKNLLCKKSSVFFLFQTEYDNRGNVLFDFLDVIKKIENLGLHYVNTIVCPTTSLQKVSFNDNALYCVWFCVDSKHMVLNKDKIREKHIWKNVEWGHRAKNYNSLGKDPGNVWIPTLDDGKGHITNHILLNKQKIIARIKKMCADEDLEFLFFSKKRKNTFLRKNQSAKAKIKTAHNKHFYNVYFKTSENMDDVRNGSISAIITSPPYWDLKNYFKRGQIGQEGYSKYLRRLAKVFSQCYLKLSSYGFMWININIRKKNDEAILIPNDIKDICRKIGFIYKGIFIWHKSSAIPVSNRNLKDHHEYILLFTKKASNTINWQNNITYCDYKNDSINYGCFWNLNRKAGSISTKTIHPAIYPTSLVDRAIKLSIIQSGVVLDPFLGSGTTLVSAANNGCSCIGFEYNDLFEDLIKSRITNETDLPLNSVSFHK